MAPHDDLIDRVAREMTEANPPGDFRVRVIARLPSARPQPWWHVPALAGGGVLLGMLIMIGTRTVVGPEAPAHPVRLSGPAASSRVVTPMRTDGPITPVSTGQPIHLGPSGPTDHVELGGPEVESAFPLLSIAPIQPSELSIAPLVVGPIVTGQIALPPIVK